MSNTPWHFFLSGGVCLWDPRPPRAQSVVSSADGSLEKRPRFGAPNEPPMSGPTSRPARLQDWAGTGQWVCCCCCALPVSCPISFFVLHLHAVLLSGGGGGGGSVGGRDHELRITKSPCEKRAVCGPLMAHEVDRKAAPRNMFLKKKFPRVHISKRGVHVRVPETPSPDCFGSPFFCLPNFVIRNS